MDRDDFWTRVEDARRGRESEAAARELETQLARLPAPEILDFDRHLRELLARAYTWELWGAAYVLEGGCSDDGFEYFRAWLVLQGREVYERALEDPDSLAAFEPYGEYDCEALLYVAEKAHERVAREEIPSTGARPPELGEAWDFDDEIEMARRYPRLAARASAPPDPTRAEPRAPVNPSPFQWSAGGWFGSQLGSTCWLLFAGLVLWAASPTAGILFLAAFALANGVGTALWLRRERLDAYRAIQWFLLVGLLATAIALVGADLLGVLGELDARISPPRLVYLALLMYPALMLVFHRRHRARAPTGSRP